MPTIIEQILLKKASQLSPRVKRMRLPAPTRVRDPIDLERRYFEDLRKLVIANLESITRKYLIPALPSLLDEAKGDLRRDAYTRAIDALFGAMRVSYGRELTEQEVDSLSRKYAAQGNDFNKTQNKIVLERVLGVNPLLSEPYLDPIMTQFIDQNTKLIKSISSEYFDKIQQDTYKHIQAGVYNKEYAKMIKADYEKQFVSQFEKGVLQKRVANADARAKLIARDQISKYNGQLNQTRQTALGLSKYRWQTSGDERVRDTHKALNGKIFSWDNPPSVGHPGDEINCRCIALPIFDVGVTENPTLLKLLNS